MSTKILDKIGLEHLWTKLKTYFAPKAHTHNAFETKHSYTVAANAAKNWYRIANASTQQLDTSKPIRAQFIVTAYNTSYAADYYETWFVNAIVFGRTAHIIIFGGSGVPFSQARILYENTVANIDANDRPAIDLYLNYVLPNGTTKIEIEEIYNNGGWIFVADGQLAASTVPRGFESVASAPRNTGVNSSTYADYVSYLNRQISNFTAAFTLADSYLYRSRTLNCTGTFTITIPSLNSGYMWCVIKNKNTSSGVITLHPSTTSVLIDGSNADIVLQPMEYVCIHSAGANNYSLIADSRWKSQKADDNAVVHNTGDETISGHKLFSDDIELKIDYNKGDSLSSNKTSFLIVHDKNGVGNPYRLGGLQLTMHTDGATDYRMLAYDNVSGSSDCAVFGLRSTSDGYRYAYASQTPTAFTDNSLVLTYSWIPYDTRIVHRSGAESIGGVKTFGNTPIVPGLNFRRTDAPVKGGTISSDYVTSVSFYDSSGTTGQNHLFGAFEVREYANMTNEVVLRAYRNATDATDAAILRVGAMPNSTYYTEVNNIWPIATNTYSCGSAQRTWKEIYSQSGTVIASDGRMKDFISTIPDVVLDAWEGVEWIQYKMKDAIALKGSAARFHSGLIAQQINGVFVNHGLDASEYGLFCYDSWDAREWDEKVVDQPESVRTVKTILEDGTLDVRDVVEPEKFHMEHRHEYAGGRYSIRYIEALCMEAAYQRRRADKLEARIKALEEKLK